MISARTVCSRLGELGSALGTFQPIGRNWVQGVCVTHRTLMPFRHPLPPSRTSGLPAHRGHARLRQGYSLSREIEGQHLSNPRRIEVKSMTGPEAAARFQLVLDDAPAAVPGQEARREDHDRLLASWSRPVRPCSRDRMKTAKRLMTRSAHVARQVVDRTRHQPHSLGDPLHRGLVHIGASGSIPRSVSGRAEDDDRGHFIGGVSCPVSGRAEASPPE